MTYFNALRRSATVLTTAILLTGVATAQDGATIFSENGCAGCHGVDGGGGMGPTLKGAAILSDFEAVVNVIGAGRGGMPAYADSMAPEELNAVAQYLIDTFASSGSSDHAAGKPNHASVPPERLVNAKSEPENWMMTFGGYEGLAHSYLDEINTENVHQLKLEFMHSIGGEKASGSVQTAPLVIDGFMYVLNGISDILKFDLREPGQAKLLWRHQPEVAIGSKMNGGIVVLNEHVYNATRDMRLIKLDGETGEVLWDVSTRNPENVNANEWFSNAPVAFGNTIVTAGAGSALRSWVAGWDAETGEMLWRWYAVPAPGEPGHETWLDDHDAWVTGGNGIWGAITYDPELDLIFFGTGEAQPWTDPQFSPGDNLFSISTVALKASTGELAWYFQEIPDDSWDYDSISTRLLHEIDIDGVATKVVSNFTRAGMYYTLERASGKFIKGGPFVNVNWTEGLDPVTGKPVEYDPTKAIQTYANNKSLIVGDPTSSQDVCPAHNGMITWWPPTLDPETGHAYAQAISACEDQIMAGHVDTSLDHRGNPVLWAGAGGSNAPTDDAVNVRGLIVKSDNVTGEQLATAETKFVLGGGLLGTAGELIFSGDRDGRFSAFDKNTMDELWHFNFGSYIGAPPMSYSIDGKQYVAIMLGGNAGRYPHPELQNYTAVPMLAVFSLAE